jgi:hypothetical protein
MISDLTPENVITNDAGATIGVSGSPIYITSESSNPTNITFNSNHLDSFGRLVVSSPFKLFEYSASQPLDTTRYHDTSTTGSGTVTRNATKTQIEFYTSTSSGDKAIFQTRRSIQYNKANSQEIFIIYRPNPVANRRERWGYFDENNGVFFEHDGTNCKVVIRSNTSGSVVDTTFAQTAWENHTSGVDWTKQHVFKIDFGWLSSRGVRFWLDVDGDLLPVKTWYISGYLDVPFMKTAQLPMRVEVENTAATASAKTSSFTCMAVQSSGAEQQEGAVRTLSTGTSTISVSTTETIGAGLRLKSGYDNASALPQDFSMLPQSGNDFVYYKVIYNPTLTGDTWNTPSDGVVDTLATVTSYTGGTILDDGHFPLGNKNQTSSSKLRSLLNDIYLGTDISGNCDPLIITFQTDAGTGDVFFTGSYREFI